MGSCATPNPLRGGNTFRPEANSAVSPTLRTARINTETLVPVQVSYGHHDEKLPREGVASASF
jgi:hypothetical protein